MCVAGASTAKDGKRTAPLSVNMHAVLCCACCALILRVACIHRDSIVSMTVVDCCSDNTHTADSGTGSAQCHCGVSCCQHYLLFTHRCCLL